MRRRREEEPPNEAKKARTASAAPPALLLNLLWPIFTDFGAIDGGDRLDADARTARNRAMVPAFLAAIRASPNIASIGRALGATAAEMDDLARGKEVSAATAQMLEDVVGFVCDFRTRLRPHELSRVGYVLADMVRAGRIAGRARWALVTDMATRLNRIMGMVAFEHYLGEPVATISDTADGSGETSERMTLGASWGPGLRATLAENRSTLVPLFVNALNLTHAAPTNPTEPTLFLTATYHEVNLPDSLDINVVFGGAMEDDMVPPCMMLSTVTIPRQSLLHGGGTHNLPFEIVRYAEPAAGPPAQRIVFAHGYLRVAWRPRASQLTIDLHLVDCDLDSMLAAFSDYRHPAQIERLVDSTAGRLFDALADLFVLLGGDDVDAERTEDDEEDDDEDPVVRIGPDDGNFHIQDSGQMSEPNVQYGELIASLRLLRYGRPMYHMLNDLLSPPDDADIRLLYAIFGRRPAPAAPEKEEKEEKGGMRARYAVSYLQCAACRSERATVVAVNPATHQGFCAPCAAK